MKWLKNLFREKQSRHLVEQAPRVWTWRCLHEGCRVSGEGNENDVRHESMIHLMTTGHSVMGDS